MLLLFTCLLLTNSEMTAKNLYLEGDIANFDHNGTEPGTPNVDLSVDAVLTNWTDDCSGVTVRIVVSNNGAALQGPTSVKVWLGNCTGGATVTTVPIPAMGAQESFVVTFDLFRPCGSLTVSALVDPDNLIQESNEANNGIETFNQC